MGAILALSTFMSPSCAKIRLSGNMLKGAFVAAMNTCVRQFPAKMVVLWFKDSFGFSENVEKYCRGLNLYKQVQELNLSGCQLSLAASRLVGNCIVFHAKFIKELNVSHCKIAQ